MIANPAISYPAAVPHPFTLNDLRVHSPIAEEPAPTSASVLTVSSLILAAVLAIGAFIWLDPLHLFTPTEVSPPASALVPSAEPARPTERQQIIAPLTPVPATKSVEVPTAPGPVVQAPHVPASAARARAASIKPESRSSPTNKTNATVLQANPKETRAPPVLPAKPEEGTAAPVLLAKPEAKTDAPIVPKLGDDTKSAPKTAAPD